jgi:hypothetical protein
MKSNMSSVDRVVRILFAITVAVLYFTNVIPGVLGMILLILGGVFLLTSLINICPIYLMLGLSTKKVKE